MVNKIWIALLIVAVMVVVFIFVALPALFYTGALNGGSLLGTNSTCIASSGYLCENVTYSTTTGYLTANIGQNTGIDMSQATLVASEANSTLNATMQLFNTPKAVQIQGGLLSGQIVTVRIPINNSLVSSGGLIWIRYAVNNATYANGSIINQYTEIATFFIKHK